MLPELEHYIAPMSAGPSLQRRAEDVARYRLDAHHTLSRSTYESSRESPQRRSHGPRRARLALEALPLGRPAFTGRGMRSAHASTWPPPDPLPYRCRTSHSSLPMMCCCRTSLSSRAHPHGRATTTEWARCGGSGIWMARRDLSSGGEAKAQSHRFSWAHVVERRDARRAADRRRSQLRQGVEGPDFVRVSTSGKLPRTPHHKGRKPNGKTHLREAL